jgi:hypothetical protein
LFRHDLLQVTGLLAQVFDCVSRGCTGGVASQSALPSFHETLRQFVIDTLGNALTMAQFGNTVFTSQTVQESYAGIWVMA